MRLAVPSILARIPSSTVARAKVAHIALQLDTGGMEKLLVEFARHADRTQIDVVFVSLGSRGRVADELERLRCPVYALGAPPGIRVELVWRLARLFRELRVTAVHAHNTKPLLYAAPAARLARVPTVVFTRHGQRRKASWGIRLSSQGSTQLVDHVVCVSRDAAVRAAADRLPARKIQTIWNGVDLDAFPCVGPIPRGPAVMVGRLHHVKDIPSLLRATAIAVGQERLFRLDIAGEGPCRAELEQLIQALSLTGVVRLLGDVENIPRLLAGASLAVLASVTEGLSLTLLEAAASGLPIVATRVGGNPEVVIDRQTGLLVPTGDPHALARAMLRLWRDPVMGRHMGLAGRRRVEQHFDAARMVAQYEALYLRKPALVG